MMKARGGAVIGSDGTPLAPLRGAALVRAGDPVVPLRFTTG